MSFREVTYCAISPLQQGEGLVVFAVGQLELNYISAAVPAT